MSDTRGIFERPRGSDIWWIHWHDGAWTVEGSDGVHFG